MNAGGSNTLGSGGIDFGAAEPLIFVEPAAALDIGGPLAGTADWRKERAGTLVLSGDNRGFSGAITVTQGSLTASHANALGGTAAGTTVAGGASLYLNGASIAAEPLTLYGGGPQGSGVLTGGGTSSLGGDVTLAGGAAVINVTTASSLELSGSVLGKGVGLTKIGTGTLILSGAVSNGYTGPTTVAAGTLQLNKSGTAVAVPGNLVIGDMAGSDVLQYGSAAGGNQIDALRIAGAEGGDTGTAPGLMRSWIFTGANKLNTDAANNRVYWNLDVDAPTVGQTTVSIYKDSGGTQLVAEGTILTPGTGVYATVVLNEQNDSGLSGSVVLFGTGLADDNTISANTLTFDTSVGVFVNTGGTFDLATNNKSESIGPLLMTGGNVATGTGTLTVTSNVVYSAGGPAVIDGNLNLGNATRTFNVYAGASLYDLTVNAAIFNGRINKTDAGLLLLTNPANTFLAGTNEVQRVTITGATAGTSQFTITFNGNTTAAITVGANDTATRDNIQAALDALANTIRGNATVSVAGAGLFNITYTGSLGTADLPNQITTAVVTTPGTFAASTVTGGVAGIVMSAGTLAVGSDTALGTARLHLTGSSQLLPVGDRALADAITINPNITITLGGRRDFGGTDDLTLSGGITLVGATSGQVVNLDVNDTLTEVEIFGVVSNGGNFLVPTKRGVGRLTLSGDNTFDVRNFLSAAALTSSDGIRLEGGILRVAHSNALGTNAESATIMIRGDLGAVLEIDGTTANGPVNITGRIPDLALTDTNSLTNIGSRGHLNRTSTEAVFTGIIRSLGGANSLVSPNCEIRLRNITDGTNASTIAIGVDAGSLNLDGAIRGLENDATPTVANNRALYKVGGGTLTLSGTTANTITGNTTITAGAALEINLAGTNTIDNETLNNLNGSGVLNGAATAVGAFLLNTGALRNLQGDNTWAGTVTIGATNTLLAVDAGTLNLAGVVAFGNNLNAVKSGPGTLQLSGTAANTVGANLGVLFVNEGTLRLDKSGAVAVPLNLAVGDGIGPDDGDVVLYSAGAAGDQIGDAATVSVHSTGLLDLATNGKSDTIAGLLLGVGATVSGDVRAGGSTLTVAGNVAAIATAGTGVTSPAAKITGTLNLGGTPTVLAVSASAAPVELDLPGPLTGTAGLTKAGSGRARLSGDNSGFSGPILVSQGVLQAASDTALGAAAADDGTALSTAMTPVWQLGLDSNNYNEFVTESGAGKTAPGSAAIRDDDWYFAGAYPAPIGVLAADEPTGNFERAITAGDSTDRIHFNLAPGHLDDTFRLVIDTVQSDLGTGVTLEVRVNDVVVHTETSMTADKTITTAPFTGASVSLTVGDNVVSLIRLTSPGTHIAFDYVRLESTPTEAAAGTRVLSGATLALDSVTTAERLTLNGPGASGQLGALAAVVGGSTVTGDITAGTVAGGGFAIGVKLGASLQIGAAPHDGSGDIDTQTSPLIVNADGDATLHGVISGTGALVKEQSATLTLDGDSTYAGLTVVNGGTLLANGDNSAATGAVTVNDGATLGGTRIIGGSVTAADGAIVSPGSPATEPGCLDTGSLAFAPESHFHVQLWGELAGDEYDQLRVTGTVDLDGATLDASRLAAYEPLTGTEFILIDNGEADEIAGTFAGVPEGALVELSGLWARISYVGGTGNDVTLTAVDPTVTLSVDPADIAENGGVATFTAMLSNASTQPVTVDLGFTGAATLADDYTRSSTQIVIAPLALSGSVTVTAVQDTLYEGNETVVVDITGVTNGTEDGVQQATTTIVDDDGPPTVTLTVDQANIAGNGGLATFTATLSEASGLAVTVDLGFSGSAAVTDDYTRSATQIVIAAGALSGFVTVTAVPDALYEGDETVLVDITGVTNGAASGVQQATTTIADDDPLPSLSINDVTVDPEGNAGTKDAVFTVTLSAAAGLPVTVN